MLCFNLLHHLEPGQIVSLFGKIREALAPGGRLAIMDAFADPGRRSSAAANFLGLFVYLSSGSAVRTPEQLRGWLHQARFQRAAQETRPADSRPGLVRGPQGLAGEAA